MKFFDHDTQAHKDDKIMLLRREHGGAAVDAYWTILEYMYREETQIKPRENPQVFLGLSLYLMTDVETLEKWTATMCELGLLICECDQDSVTTISSPRAAATIDAYQQRMVASKENGKKGGRPKKTAGKNPVVFSEEPSGNPTVPNEKPRENLDETKTEPKPNLEKPEGEGEVDIQEKEKINKKEKEENDQEERRKRCDFLQGVIEIFNQETASDVREVSEDVKYKVMNIYDNNRTLDDVRLVTRDRFLDWSENPKLMQWIRPATFYGPRFEEYLGIAKARAKKHVEATAKEERYAKYA